VREPDGLALSSRNQYLDPDQRRQATVLWQALREARGLIENGERNAKAIRRAIATRLASATGGVLEYVAIVRMDTLEAIERLQGAVLIALAVRFGSTRLIDNVQLKLED